MIVDASGPKLASTAMPPRLANRAADQATVASGADGDWSLALGLLFWFLVALYATTSAGHSSSNDQEELYYVTQGLVERGSTALPREEGEALQPKWPRIGPDGNYYSSHEPLPSFLAIPFYLAGKGVASLFAPRFHDFLTRAAVTMLSALAGAATAVVLALIARELGLTPRRAVVIGLLFGTTTIAWPYAHYFWNEPLAALFLAVSVLFAIRGSRCDSAAAWLVAAVAFGLATMTRQAMLASLPALGLYLVIGTLRGDGARAALARVARQATGFGAVFLVALAALAGYNVLRFGSVLGGDNVYLQVFSHGPQALQWAFGGDLRVGVAGLLLSPGKSLFLYSPLAIVAVAAIPAFLHWAPREAWLCSGLVGTHLALAALLPWWHGDAAWGPRYLVPLTPYLLLPLAAWLRPAGRLGRRSAYSAYLVAVAAGLGLAVQVLAVTTNFNTYILETGGPEGPGAERRWFSPAASPLLAAPRQLHQRTKMYLHRLAPGQYALGQGFYEPEAGLDGLPAWTSGRAAVRFLPREPGPGTLTLRLLQPDHGRARPLPALTLYLDHQAIPLPPTSAWQPAPGHYTLQVPLPELQRGEHHLELRSPTFVPAEQEPGSTDQRHLGVQVLEMSFDLPGGRLARVALPVVPPLPVSAEQPWSRTAFGWFYDPRVPHLLDLWPWYVAHSGLPPSLALLWLVPLLTTLWSGRALSQYLAGVRPPAPAPPVLARRLKPALAGLVLATTGMTLVARGPAFSATTPDFPTDPLLAIDWPLPGTLLAERTTLHGWAVDRNAARAGGVDAVELYLGKERDLALLGRAIVSSPRPDIAVGLAAERFTHSGWSYAFNPALYPPGLYSLVAVAHGTDTERTRAQSVSLAIVPAADGPAHNAWMSRVVPELVGVLTQRQEMESPLIATGQHRVRPGDYRLAEGFYASEQPDRLLPRWTNGQGVIDFHLPRPGPVAITLRFTQPVVETTRAFPHLEVAVDTVPVPRNVWHLLRLQPGQYQLSFLLPIGASEAGVRRLELRSPAFVPAKQQPGNPDQRRLGIQLQAIGIMVETERLSLAAEP